ncbi:hypothetical protein [Nocardioides sp. CFH 31398]|uniref:divisome protein SepX/GlpR n=1 Tax=Nocardioides sp. CFH 31398 TaxID=2919579 RepID=UPI001F062D71|nr:hypothetical protein [Nocardioides sp. CFH 31398]MCH1865294.1 hypothetical protein [Nocardioides sp. CFH 31398]
MDLSAVIFVALAVAWAVYLVPKALKHHDEVARTRSVDRFSATMRTLARREPAVATGAPAASAGGRVVVTPGRPASVAEVTTKPRGARVGTAVADPAPALTPAQRRARREAAAAAARRRRRVLGTLLVALLASVAVAAFGVTSWWLVAAPAALIVMWLVACRAMVRGERRAKRIVVRTDAAGDPVAVEEVDEGVTLLADVPPTYDVERSEEGFDEVGAVAETSSMDAAEVDPELWEPRPVTLPTYVGKEIAPLRHAKMLHKNEKGVWTSGHDTSDSIMAQDARAAERETSRTQPREDRPAERSSDYSGGRAVGS